MEVRGDRDTAVRKEVVLRRLAFDSDPEGYTKSVRRETKSVRERIANARSVLPMVSVPDGILDAVVRITTHFDVDGHRADITMLKAARANAALEGRSSVTADDIRAVATPVLSHRMRRRPFEEEAFDPEELETCLKGI